MTALCLRGLAARQACYWLAASILLAAPACRAIAAQPIVVRMDEARMLKLPDRAVTVVIGNPLIADLAIQPGGLAVITAKSYGATNVIVLDKSGAVLTEHELEVEGPADPTVVVYRGVDRRTYSCTPQCVPRVTLGDETDYFTKLLNDGTTRSTQALAAGAGATH
jgi:Pilus formation protein N terminal region